MRQRVESHGNAAEELLRWRRRRRYYYGEIERYVGQHVAPGSSVLHVGCGCGDLLAALRPARGVGIDDRADVVELARARHAHITALRFETTDLTAFAPSEAETFDSIVIDSALADMDDIQACLECVAKACRPETRLILCHYNALWGPLLRFASAVGLRRPTGEQNWLGPEDFDNLLRLTGFEPISRWAETLAPLPVPLLAAFANRILAKFWPWRHLCLSQFVVARPLLPLAGAEKFSCSVVIPTRNERGNIEDAVRRLPPIGSRTEIIFVDGNSTDGTAEEIERVIAANPQRTMTLIHQGDGTGKGDAVRKGFDAATGDVLMILDADLTVPPEDLPRFYRAIVEGRGEFINGTRLVYPMEREAMRFLNKAGNRFFSLLFTWLIGQRFRDTLCGTKVLRREHYHLIEDNRAYFGEFDPFGDFDLIFGAARADLKIIEIPVRYRARSYGETNISRFRHGWMLLRMSWVAFRKLKMR
jgi:SAM-dependent methyltransferase